MGGSVGSILKTVTAIVKDGPSGVTSGSTLKNVKDTTKGVFDPVTGGLAGQVIGLVSPSAPGVDTSAINVANKAREAANAVQTADAEARRARNAKRQSSVLGNYQDNAQTNAATLQPAQPRRSVLG